MKGDGKLTEAELAVDGKGGSENEGAGGSWGSFSGELELDGDFIWLSASRDAERDFYGRYGVVHFLVGLMGGNGITSLIDDGSGVDGESAFRAGAAGELEFVAAVYGDEYGETGFYCESIFASLEVGGPETECHAWITEAIAIDLADGTDTGVGGGIDLGNFFEVGDELGPGFLISPCALEFFEDEELFLLVIELAGAGGADGLIDECESRIESAIFLSFREFGIKLAGVEIKSPAIG